MYRQKQLLPLVKAVSDLSWLLYNDVPVVLLWSSKYVNLGYTVAFVLSETLLKTPFSLQNFANSISRLLLPVDGAHAASCEEMATAMSKAESAAHKGLQQCIDTVMAEV